MKKWSLLLMSFSFLVSAFADEGKKIDEKIFVRPFVDKISKQVAVATQSGNPEAVASSCSTGRCGELPAFVSFNVGYNIPSSGQVVSAEGSKSISLNAYVAEFANSIAANGNAVVTAPASYEVVFTDGSRSYEEIYSQIDEVLSKIGTQSDSTTIKQALAELKGVNRATFISRENKLTLVTDARSLRVGETIWRITPHGVQRDVYHSEEEYLVAFRNAGFVCEEIARPSFFGELKWKMYNESLKDKNETLGIAYVDHNPFTIYHLKKVK